MYNEATYELIESYLQGTLDTSAKEAFELRMQNDPLFAEEVEMHRMAQNAVNMSFANDLRTEIQNDIKQIDKTNNRKKLGYGLAALALIIATSTVLWVNNEGEKQDATLEDVVIQNIAKDTTQHELTFNPTETKAEKPVEKAVKPNAIAPEKIETKSVNVDTVSTKIEEIKEDIKIVSTQDPEVINVVKKETKKVAEQPQKTTKPVAEKVNCDRIKIQIAPTLTATCNGKSDGQIVLYPENVKGGKSPYKIAFEQQIITVGEEQITGLEAGQYQLTITDANSCATTHSVEIIEKNCAQNKIAIRPDVGEVWNPTLTQDAMLKIFNQAGLLVYATTLYKGEYFEWSGVGQNGVPLNAGLYAYTLINTDKTIVKGQITIIR